jgi:dipeptidyl aminopeptidase/acylaminoacyl peptidase
MRVFFRLALPLGLATAPLAAQRPLDHDAYDRWKTISQETLSRDGRWVAYLLDLERGDDTLKARATSGAAEHTVPRGRDARFTPDARHLVFLIKPEDQVVRAARRAKKRGDDLPKDSLGILDLATGQLVRVERVRAMRVPERAGGWIAYELERPREPRSPGDSGAARVDTAGPKSKPEAEVGYPLVIRNLATGAERRIGAAAGYAFPRNGERLAVAISHKTGETDGVVVVELADGSERRIAGGRGAYRGLAFDDAGTQLAFVTSRDDTATTGARYALYHWRVGDAEARAVVRSGTAGVSSGWTVSENRTPSFSRRGNRLFFGTAPWVAPAAEDSTPEDEQVRVDIWHWQDAELQPMQLRRAEQARRRSYLAVLHLAANRVAQLGDILVADVTLPDGGDAPFGLGEAEGPYQMLVSWDSPAYRDVYVVDLDRGTRTRILEKTQAQPGLSPNGGYATWFDRGAGGWITRHLRSGRTLTVSAGIPHPLTQEEHDTPSPAPPYGMAGWADDGALLVYDRYDVWALDPDGRRAPQNVTDGLGRREGIRFRVVDLDRERAGLDDGLLLSAFNTRDKQAGFYRDRVTGSGAPERLVWADRRFATPRKADAADVLLLTRESVAEFPDLWAAAPDLRDLRRLTDANPQQAEYRWATVELVEWRGADGTPLRGLLYKPADFDPARRYPLLVNFYERNADNLFAYHPPLPHRSSIRPTFYASRGYVVFVPDVVYRTGYPGQSALDCVVPGVLELIRRGFVDPERVGVQGHSWGGYQIAYLVTKTNVFRAAAAGAPVANMTSAYGGIRWESGMSRMFQYERTQSRIGRTLWDAPLRYLENSPLFWADRIETPLLILHNDNDGAVPWYQGIELFTAMRRLGKPAWLVNYNGEPHWPLPYPKRRDWNIRMQQFFDHYLMGAPEPEWLAKGVPATEKGRTLGLELVTEGK